MTTEKIKAILERLNIPRRHISEQTAVCIMAFLDKSRRTGLLSGHNNLSEGARIHDILNFARDVLNKKVAENTREAYRKTSLAPLMNHGIVVRHQLSTNDPNTYYRLHPDFARLFSEADEAEQQRLIEDLHIQASRTKMHTGRKAVPHGDVTVEIAAGETFALSPGAHNQLEKAVVELFGRAFMREPQVIYLGDTAPRKGYQNRTLMRRLNLPIDTSASLPDIILLSEPQKDLVIVEVVTSSGAVSMIRLDQLKKLAKAPRGLGYRVSYITAFPSRSVFRRFVEEIAWGSSVWIENEPNNIVHFQRMNE